MRPLTVVRPPQAALTILAAILALVACCGAQDATFHTAPAADAAAKNPYQSSPAAAAAGKKLYGQNCAQCHGNNLQGMGPAPALDTPAVKTAKPGELYWFISTGDLNKGMPNWSSLPKQQRWQIVTFLQTKSGSSGAK